MARVNGHLDLAGNEVQRVNIENVENFPTTPTPGRFIFKDNRPYMCIELDGGIPIWAALTPEISTHIHNQTEQSSVWTITHNFNTALVMVQIIDENNFAVVPNEIDLSVINQVTVTFSQAVMGKAIVMLAQLEGEQKPNYAFEQTFTEQTSIVVNHGLGYNPIARVYIDNREVQPQSITHNSTTQLTVTFSNAQTGVVRCI